MGIVGGRGSIIQFVIIDLHLQQLEDHFEVFCVFCGNIVVKTST